MKTKRQETILKLIAENRICTQEGLQEKLKEYVGHTPLQVAAGAILGIALAVFMAQYY